MTVTTVKPPYIIHDTQGARVTLGIKLDETGQIFMAVALCNPKDAFVRKVGFTKVMGMLSSPNLKPVARYVGEDWKADILPAISEILKAFRVWGPGTCWWGRQQLRSNLFLVVRCARNVEELSL